MYLHNETGEELTEDEAEGLPDCEYIGNRSRWEVRQWLSGGRSILVDTYDTEEDAEERLWDFRIYDFDKDDQRDTAYYMTEAEAQIAWEESFKH